MNCTVHGVAELDIIELLSLTTQTFVGKMMSLLLSMLSRFIIAFLPYTYEYIFIMLIFYIYSFIHSITYSLRDCYVLAIILDARIHLPLSRSLQSNGKNK